MNLNRYLLAGALSLLLIGSLVGGSGCANIVPPAGGPRDSLPPVLVKSSPRDSSLGFSSNRIYLTFDEYVDLDNYQQNLIVSPVPTYTPTVTRKLNTITVKIRDTLEPNTTYSLNFGNSIKDINEGNVMKNFTYVFATGRHIDSLQLSGHVLMAETGDIDTTLMVILHRSKDDSAVTKEKPRYVARVDGKGDFHFRNLPPGTFYLYALKDQSGTYRYTGGDQVFAFADSAVVIGRSAPQTLYAYAGPVKPVVVPAPRPTKQSDKRLKMSTSLQGKQDLLDKLVMRFETPLKNFDSSKVHFYQDSTYTPITNYRWTMDSTRKTDTLTYAWQEEKLYHLVLEKDFATDTLGFQLLKPDTITFFSRSHLDYGKLSIRFRNLDLSAHPVLQVVEGTTVKYSFPLTSANFNQALFPPGEYSLRILNDTNGNGKWDPGEFVGKHRQPELVKPVNRKITVKQAWENEFEIDVTAPPASAGTQPQNGPAQQRQGLLNR